MRRAALIALALLALLAVAAPASAVPLTKRQAHSAGLTFVTPVVDLLDVNKPFVRTHMDPPGLCRRINGRTVDCFFWAYLEADHRTVSGFLRVHRQRDGLIGILLPWDPARMMVQS